MISLVYDLFPRSYYDNKYVIKFSHSLYKNEDFKPNKF